MIRRKPLLLATALTLAAACMPAPARPLVDLAVVDRDSGRWLPRYQARGDSWVAGVPGHRYSVRLTNTTGERVLVVLSVDGVNAVSGEDADPAQAGYVLAPWQSAEIAGWRKSLDDVAQFYFTEVPDSYAARTGRPGNVGVIGIAVYREASAWRSHRAPRAPLPQPPYPVARDEARADRAAPAVAGAAAAGAPAMERAIPQQRLGTGHGAREWSPVGRTAFVRATRSPAQIVQVRYDAPERLAALGIPPRHWRDPRAPDAFPGGFVADPPAWR